MAPTPWPPGCVARAAGLQSVLPDSMAVLWTGPPFKRNEMKTEPDFADEEIEAPGGGGKSGLLSSGLAEAPCRLVSTAYVGVQMSSVPCARDQQAASRGLSLQPFSSQAPD